MVRYMQDDVLMEDADADEDMMLDEGPPAPQYAAPAAPAQHAQAANGEDDEEDSEATQSEPDAETEEEADPAAARAASAAAAKAAVAAVAAASAAAAHGGPGPLQHPASRFPGPLPPQAPPQPDGARGRSSSAGGAAAAATAAAAAAAPAPAAAGGPLDAPGGSGGLDDEGWARMTARQRARVQKEAGLAEDVAWSEMDLLPKLTYSWKGGRGPKAAAAHLSEEEWLKRQEALERRRVRSLRDKREAEEAVKARIRRAVTARFRGRLGGSGGGGGDASAAAGGATPSGTQGGGGGAAAGQPAAAVAPGWVKVHHTARGVRVAWHPAAHPLSLPMAVKMPDGCCREPIDLQLQPPPGAAGQWHVPASSGFKLGCVLTLQPGDSAAQQPPQQQEAVLQCLDEHAQVVGSLRQQQVLDALELAGYPDPLQDHQQQPDVQQGRIDWRRWQAVVRSVARAAPADDDGGQQRLRGVVVRLVAPQLA